MENESTLSDEDLALILSGNLVVLEDGRGIYRDDKHHLHRDDGPAIIDPDGSQRWYQDDKLTKTTRPKVSLITGGDS